MEFEYYLEENIWQLHKDLMSLNYKHGGYTNFCISDTKKRSINNAFVRDKVLHRLLFDKLTEFFEPKFIYHLYSSRKEKGVHKMLRYVKRCARNIGHNRQCYVLHIDVRKYFDSIDHSILKRLLTPALKTYGLEYIATEVVSSFASSVGKGIPLGNITSQIFANIYLLEFDWFVINNLKLKMYSRYNDDIFVVSENIQILKDTSQIMVDWLFRERLLVVPKEKVSFYRLSRGIPILGYEIFAKRILLKGQTKQNRQVLF